MWRTVLKNGCHYSETSVKYQISYGQAYQWVKKFREKGIDGLKDKRGQAKPTEEMSELERLRVENRLLTAENKRVELENGFLKKLDEIERRRS